MFFSKRFYCDLALFALIIFAPWYWAAAAILIFSVLFSWYWEGFAAGLIIDSFYSLPENIFWGGFGFFSASALALIFASSFLRGKIRA